jgi:NADH-quinone oxidoreductase subunit M
MDFDYPLLSLLIWLPVLGTIAVMLINQEDKVQEYKNARAVALWISSVNLVLAVFLLLAFDSNEWKMQFVERDAWVPMFNVFYHIGVDGVSLPFVFLTALLTPLAVLSSWKNVRRRAKLYMASFLALEGFIIGTLCSLDLILFYTFWEATVIPLFFIIGIWGGENKTVAAVKFFALSVLGSIFMLVGILYLFQACGKTFDIKTISSHSLSLYEQRWLWAAFFMAFAVRTPLWPFHIWLPDVHVQVPAAGSIILTGALIKLGAYGLLRFNLPLFPEASVFFMPAVFAFAGISVIWTALAAFAQTDVKRMLAYLSASCMGLIIIAIFAGTENSMRGAILQVINHSVISAGLFMLIGFVYDRLETRNIAHMGGLVEPMPVYAFFFAIFMLASVSVPFTGSFIGEFLMLLGVFEYNPAMAIVCILGCILSAMCMLWLYRKMVWGKVISDHVHESDDINSRELWILMPCLAITLLIEIAPDMVTKITSSTIDNIYYEYMTYTALENEGIKR